MTKEITKAIILQEIQDKFKLREWEPANFLFDETVVPVYNVNPHLAKPERKEYTISVTSTGAKGAFNVPATEQWRLHRYTIIFVSGSFTIAGLFIARPTPSDYVYLDLAAAQNTSYLNDLPKDAILRPGDGLYINADGYTSTGDLLVIIDVTVEGLR